MSYRPALALVLALSQLAACNAGKPTAIASRPTPVAIASAKASPAAPAAVVLGPLAAPKGDSTSLQGTLTVDPAYLVAQNVAQVGSLGGAIAVFPTTALDGSKLVASGAGNLVASGAGNIVSHDAGGIVSHDAGGLVASGGGNLIAADPAAILASDAATLISQDGGSIVSHDAGGIVSHDAGGLVASGAGNRRVLDAASLAADLPAAGFAVRVVGLADNRPLPVGTDAQGHPIYVVYTDAKGRYDLHLPAKLAGNVRLIASIAGSTDPRARLEFVVPPAGQKAQAATEASALTSATLLLSMHTEIVGLLQGVTHKKSDSASATSQAAIDLILVQGQRLIDAATKAGVKDLTAAQQDLFATLLSNLVCSQLVLDDLRLPVSSAGYASDGTERVNPAFEATFAKVREAAKKKLQADPRCFDAKPYLVAANAARAKQGRPPYVLREASDVANFLITEYFISDDGEHQRLSQVVFADLGLPVTLTAYTRAAYAGTILALVGLLGTESKLDEIVRQTTQLVADLKAPGGPKPAPLPTPGSSAVPAPVPGPESYALSTLAVSDGASHDAHELLGRPVALRLAPNGDLYFIDYNGFALRKIELGKPEHPVSLVAGGLGGDKSQRTAALANFQSPQQLAIEAIAGGLAIYVSEDTAHRLSRVVVPDPAGAAAPVTVETFANVKGDEGADDGPAADATFKSPHGLVIDGQRHLLVADSKNHSVRSIALDDPKHAVTTLVGPTGTVTSDPTYLISPIGLAFAGRQLVITDDDSGSHGVFGLLDGALQLLAGKDVHGSEDGFFASGHFKQPTDVVAAPDGSLLVADPDGPNVRRIRLDPTSGVGVVSTLVTAQGDCDQGATDAPRIPPGDGAGLCQPTGVAIDAKGTIYVADQVARCIRVLTPRP